MKHWKTSSALVVALVFCATLAFAQDQKQDDNTSPTDPNAPLQPLDTTPPGAPGSAYPNKPPVGVLRGGGIATPEAQPYDPAQVTPDQNTLAGAAPITLGSLQHSVNIFDPAISVSQLGQAVPGAPGKTAYTGVTVAGGSLNFNRTWSEYRFTTLYNGGETFNLGYGAASSFFGPTAPHYQFHNLAITQTADWARWHILLSDNFVASPGAAFSSQGTGGPGLAAQFSSMMGGSLNSIAQSFVPSETIDTGEAMRYRNSVLGQVEYSFSRRSAVTFSGSYGLLDFSNAGYINSTMVGAQAGYDYLLDPANSIAILASYGKIDYTVTGSPSLGTGSSTQDYMGALAYGRKITGRLAFQAAVGPQEINANFPSGTGNFHLLFVAANSALTYERRRSGFSFTFVRGLSGGSGVFLGATSNTISGTAHHQFTRYWAGSLNGGYALTTVSLRQAWPPRNLTIGLRERTLAGNLASTRQSISITARCGRTIP